MSSENEVHIPEVRVNTFGFSVRLASIFFPIQSAEMIDISSKIGFVRVPNLPSDLPPGGRLIVAGIIARKGEYSILIDPNRSVLGVQGKEIPAVIEYFDQLQRAISEELSVNIDEEARFYEIVADLSIVSRRDPIIATSSLFCNSRTITSLGGLLGGEVRNYGVRLVPGDGAPTADEWFDYRIEPLQAKPHSEYYSSVVYRSKNKDNVVAASVALLDKMRDLVEAMEEG